MSNAGPLTTTFTAPSSCATAIGVYQIWPESDSYYYEQGPLLSRTECYPNGYDASPSQYYSPGLCPTGYTAACSSTGLISHTVTETAYTCCPTAADYTCANTADAITLSQSYFGCTTTFDQALVLVGVTAISDGHTDLLQSATAGAGTGLGANSIAVKFRSGDFSSVPGANDNFATATSVLSYSTSGALDTATLAIPIPTSTASSAPKQRHVGVTTTQAIGIGVGSAAAALIAAGVAGFCLWLRRKKQKIRAQIETPIPPPAPPPKDRKYRTPPPLKLDRSNRHSQSSSGIASIARSVNGKMIRGPFELGSHGKEEKILYGVYGEHRNRSQVGSPNSADPLRSPSNTVTPSFWSPPSSYGFQPAELESPQRTLESPHRGMTSPGSGYKRSRVELASP
ncbi:hypothetical protein VMCG_03483 [Cytospora schulzeri]|uniref:Uncharacterized protein n=1 Tax=Cytospora schulzeri TaxID=448051 RepID=A0A423WWK5_9PEZI|nr:hypothetical protein VMCG_03483 [Valsa malicola]